MFVMRYILIDLLACRVAQDRQEIGASATKGLRGDLIAFFLTDNYGAATQMPRTCKLKLCSCPELDRFRVGSAFS